MFCLMAVSNVNETTVARLVTSLAIAGIKTTTKTRESNKPMTEKRLRTLRVSIASRRGTAASN